jgi:hypothetical protein
MTPKTGNGFAGDHAQNQMLQRPLRIRKDARRYSRSGHEVEEQGWLVNGDRQAGPPNRQQEDGGKPSILSMSPKQNKETPRRHGCHRKDGRAESGAAIPGRTSMRGRFRPQFFNLVLECQLAPLEIHDFEVVDRRMIHRIIDFAFDVAVFPLQLIKMGCKRHDWFSLSWFPRLQPPRRVHRRLASVTA